MDGPPVTQSADAVRIAVWAVAGSSRPGLAGAHGDMLKVRVSAPPADGRANREISRILESRLGRPAVLIEGMTGRRKVFEVADVDAGSIRRKLGLGA